MTTPQDASPEDAAGQMAQLRQFIHWMFAIVGGFALLYGLAFALFGNVSSAAVAVVLLAYFGLLLFARHQLHSARLKSAVTTVCGGLLAANLLIVLVQPPLYPIFAMIPLVAIAVALPFVRGRRLLLLLATCWLSTVAALLIGEFVRSFADMPFWFERLIRVTGVSSAAALALLLLWQFSSRLNATLDRMRDMLASLRRAQAAQLRSQETFTALLNATPDLMMRLAADGTCLDFKPAAGAEASPGAQHYVGKRIEAFLPAPIADTFKVHVARALASGAMQVWEYKILSGGGQHDHEARIVVSSSDEVLVIVRDITERKRGEEQRLALERNLLESQRLESIGVLAGGVAHDFNNLLTAILGNAEIVRADLPASSPLRDPLGQIEAAADRAAGLTRQLLAYSGKGRFVVERIDLNELIRETAGLATASVGKMVELRYELARDLPRVEGDAAQMRQVVMNLVTNAAEAIGERAGTIELRTTHTRLGAADLAAIDLPSAKASDDYVVLEVCDTGQGMDAETRARMFEPFFTTKFVGRGLGLAAVQGIVRGHGGGLKVASMVGQGTTFTIMLPAARAEQRAPASATAPAARGSVLVIDDEPGVRLVAARMLERLGFTVVQAENGLVGVELFRRDPHTIDWVLVDLTMPQMGGAEVLDEVQHIRPGTPVVLMSGYSEEAAVRRLSDGAQVEFLQKPFSPRDLQDVVRRVAEARPA